MQPSRHSSRISKTRDSLFAWWHISNGYFHKQWIFSPTIFKAFCLPYGFIPSEWIFFDQNFGETKHFVLSKHYLSLGNYKLKEQWDTTTHFLEWLQFKKLAINCWQGYRATGSFILCWWDCKMVQLLWQIGSSFQS